MYFTNYAEGRILQAFRGTVAAAPQTLYAALFLSNPGETGQGAEIHYPGYERKVITFSQPAPGDVGTSIANLADLAFAASSIATGDVTHAALMDSAVAGNMWAYIALDEPIQIAAGVAPLLQAKEWNYTLTGNFTGAMMTRVLNVLRGVDLPGISPHIALYNGHPDQGGAELAGAGYARFPVVFGAPAVQPSGQSTIFSTELACSPRSLDYWGTMTHTVLFTAERGGEAVIAQEYLPHMIMGRGKAVFIRPGEYAVSLN